MFLRELYAKEHYGAVDSPIEKELGSVLYRSRGDISTYNVYDEILDEYHRFQILKFYGLSLGDWLELTPRAKLPILAAANRIMEATAKEYDTMAAASTIERELLDE